MITQLDRNRRTPIDRSGDRLVALVAMGLALGFMAAALVSLSLPDAARRGVWLPLHLALAGGASTAIAGVLPFFVAAFAAAPPARTAFRMVSVAAVAFGATFVAIGVVASLAVMAGAGGVLFIGGICLVAVVTLSPVRVGLGPRGGIVTRSYLAALAMVGIGALLATLMITGWPPIVAAWYRLRPAHAWLNLVGFVSLTIAATLIHFFPTVVGSRIAAHPSARAALAFLAFGSPLVAIGYASGFDVAVRFGAAVALLGALALVVYAAHIWTRRALWTTDRSWHRFSIGGLISAITWFTVGMAILSGRAIAWPEWNQWSVEPVIAPLVVGWIGLAVVASASHLLPAVGPGSHAAHARQRVVLGQGAEARLVAANVGVAGLTAGQLTGLPAVTEVGGLAVAASFVATGVVISRALWIGFKARSMG